MDESSSSLKAAAGTAGISRQLFIPFGSTPRACRNFRYGALLWHWSLKSSKAIRENSTSLERGESWGSDESMTARSRAANSSKSEVRCIAVFGSGWFSATAKRHYYVFWLGDASAA